MGAETQVTRQLEAKIGMVFFAIIDESYLTEVWDRILLRNKADAVARCDLDFSIPLRSPNPNDQALNGTHNAFSIQIG